MAAGKEPMNQQEINTARDFLTCKKNAIAKLNTCFYPGCEKKAINSHILQKNGMLSLIAKDGHLWEMVISPFRYPPFHFQKTGINKIFSFKCFCADHDREIFSDIEQREFTLNTYKTHLLFVVRVFYSELYRKLIVREQYDCLIKKANNIETRNNLFQLLEQTNLSIRDLNSISGLLWQDIESKTESFVFKLKILRQLDIVLASIFTHETTDEIQQFKHQNSVEPSKLSRIFITLFPYNNKSILIMGYPEEDAAIVSGYLNRIFNQSEKRLERELTNFLLFRCENWACSSKFYFRKLRGVESLFYEATKISRLNTNERKVHRLNMFRENFQLSFKKWVNDNSDYNQH